MKNKMYLIGNAHIDPVWQWRWQDGFSEIKATFRSVLDRMNEFPEMKFSCAGAIYYEWIEKNDPEMFAEIKKRAEEGSWCIVGGWFLQPDCNMPCGESFARHGLISQNYFLEKFGRMAKSGYNVDSFGHNGALPQILKKSGMDSYVFMRPMKHEKTLPSNLFRWKGIDGSEITAYRIPDEYCLTSVEAIDKTAATMEAESDFDWMAFYGVGNHGGGPTIRLLQNLRASYGENKQVLHATVDEYFENTVQSSLPVVSGDMQYHARGCYSVETALKKYNRKSENNTLAAEVFSVLSECLAATEYPAKKLKKAWKNTLFNQFHDVLCGCVVQPAVEDASYLYGETMSISEQAIHLALQRISWKIDTLKGHTNAVFRDDRFFPFTHEVLGSPVVLFNPLPFAVRTPVTIYPKCTRVEEENGAPVPAQRIRGWQTDGVENRYNTAIYTEIPAYGYKVVRIFREGDPVVKPVPFSYGDDYIENDCLRVRFDRETGGIKEFYDKKRDRQLLSASSTGVWFDDTDHDTWAHNVYSFDKKLAGYADAEMHVTELGEMQITMRVTSRCGGFTLRQDYTLYDGDDVLHVTAKTSGCEKHRILKLAFPVNVRTPQAFTEIPYGVIERDTDNAEYPCGKWFAVTDKDGAGGLAVLNEDKYSFSVDGTTAYLTVLRTAIYCDHYGQRDEFCEYIDVDAHTFRYALAPFVDPADAQRRALALNMPPRAILETFHEGTLPTSFSGVEIGAQNVVISAMKKAENGLGYIFRAYESAGKAVETRIRIPLLGVETHISFAPFEIKTFRVCDGKTTPTDLIES